MILTLSFSKRINLQVTAKEDARLILVVVSFLLRFKCLTKRNGVLLLIRTVLSNKGFNTRQCLVRLPHATLCGPLGNLQ